jgi:anti-sigma factor RsiW
MTCEDFDSLLCDYIDGTLPAEKKQVAEVHIGTCPPCALLVRDSRFVLTLASHAADIEPPRELVTRILNQAPRGGFAERMLSDGLRGFFAPVLQPRFVMGAMLTVLSLSMMTRCAGAPKHTLTAADLDPVRLLGSLDDKVLRTWDRSIKAYESMRVVYEVQSRVAEWKQKQQEDEDESLRLPKAKSEASQSLKVKEGQSK